jgi:hypothetical protein
LAKAYALTAPGQPVFDDLRRWNGAEWKRGPVERFIGRRWNGAEWNRLESAKSGPKASRCVGESCFRRLIGGRGFVGGLLPHFDVLTGLLCKWLIINAIYLHESFRMDSQCPTECARITARLVNWAKRKGETDGDIAIEAVYEGAFFERSWPKVVGAVF